MFQRLRNIIAKLKSWFIHLLVLLTLVATLGIIGFSSLVLICENGGIDISFKRDFAGNLMEGTLALSAIALTVLGFSVSQMYLADSTFKKRPYKRIGYIMYCIIPLSMADALVSAIFLLTEDPLVFSFSISLLYVVAIGVISSVSLWAIKELK